MAELLRHKVARLILVQSTVGLNAHSALGTVRRIVRLAMAASIDGRPILVDAAGALMGGAARFLGQLDTYLEGQAQDGVEVIGRAESITPR